MLRKVTSNHPLLDTLVENSLRNTKLKTACQNSVCEKSCDFFSKTTSASETRSSASDASDVKPVSTASDPSQCCVSATDCVDPRLLRQSLPDLFPFTKIFTTSFVGRLLASGFYCSVLEIWAYNIGTQKVV